MLNQVQKTEKSIRNFVRSQFRAYVVRPNGATQEGILRAKGKAEVLISNPKCVLEHLYQTLGRPVTEEKNATTFRCKQVGLVTLRNKGDMSILTLTNTK